MAPGLRLHRLLSAVDTALADPAPDLNLLAKIPYLLGDLRPGFMVVR